MSEPKFAINQNVRHIDGPPVMVSVAPIESGSVDMVNLHGWGTVRMVHHGNDDIHEYDVEFEDDREMPPSHTRGSARSEVI